MGNIKGERGIQGIQGEKGEDGTKIWASSANFTDTSSTTSLEALQINGTPSSGDMMLCQNGNLYSLEAMPFNGWRYTIVACLKGEQGVQGIQGEQGIQGAQGDQGEPGEDGASGTDGKSIRYYSAALSVDSTTADISIEEYYVLVGDLLLDPNGLLFQVTEYDADADVATVEYLMTISGGGESSEKQRIDEIEQTVRDIQEDTIPELKHDLEAENTKLKERVLELELQGKELVGTIEGYNKDKRQIVVNGELNDFNIGADEEIYIETDYNLITFVIESRNYDDVVDKTYIVLCEDTDKPEIKVGDQAYARQNSTESAGGTKLYKHTLTSDECYPFDDGEASYFDKLVIINTSALEILDINCAVISDAITAYFVADDWTSTSKIVEWDDVNCCTIIYGGEIKIVLLKSSGGNGQMQVTDDVEEL
jgi:hypothetical protein